MLKVVNGEIVTEGEGVKKEPSRVDASADVKLEDASEAKGDVVADSAKEEEKKIEDGSAVQGIKGEPVLE